MIPFALDAPLIVASCPDDDAGDEEGDELKDDTHPNDQENWYHDLSGGNWLGHLARSRPSPPGLAAE